MKCPSVSQALVVTSIVHVMSAVAAAPSDYDDYEYDTYYYDDGYLERESCAWNEYRADDLQCLQCPSCPQGYRYSEPCGEGRGHANVQCIGCEAGYYHDGNSDQMHACEWCYNCSALHRDELRGCPENSGKNALCSTACWEGYEDTEPDRTDPERPTLCMLPPDHNALYDLVPDEDYPYYSTSGIPDQAATFHPVSEGTQPTVNVTTDGGSNSSLVVVAFTTLSTLLGIVLLLVILYLIWQRYTTSSWHTTNNEAGDEDGREGKGEDIELMDVSNGDRDNQQQSGEPESLRSLLQRDGAPASHPQRASLPSIHSYPGNRGRSISSLSLNSAIYRPLVDAVNRGEPGGAGRGDGRPRHNLDSVQPASTYVKTPEPSTIHLHPDR